jgi:hypothetical protein
MPLGGKLFAIVGQCCRGPPMDNRSLRQGCVQRNEMMPVLRWHPLGQSLGANRTAHFLQTTVQVNDALLGVAKRCHRCWVAEAAASRATVCPRWARLHAESKRARLGTIAQAALRRGCLVQEMLSVIRRHSLHGFGFHVRRECLQTANDVATSCSGQASLLHFFWIA